MMIHSKLGTLTALLTGTSLVAIGGTMTVAPQVMFGMNGIDLGSEANLLSEVRAAGSVLLVFGALLLASLSFKRLRRFAFNGAGLLLLATALGRFVSLLADGSPSPSLQVALAAELVLGGLCLLYGTSTGLVSDPSRQAARCSSTVLP